MKRIAAALFALCCYGATALDAQLVVGNDQSGTATIYEVSTTTGVATPIYSGSGSDAKPWGMAYDPSTNTLYWNNGSTLYSSPYGNPLVPTNLGTMMYNAATVNFVGLGFSSGSLYGTRNIATEAVYQINPTTLVATLVYAYSSTLDFGGVDIDSVTGTLYGLSDSGGAGLYEIDPIGMTTTLRAPYPMGETDIDGLAAYNGTAYYVTDGPNSTQTSFYVFDIATGMQTGALPSPFTGSGTFAAAAFVPPGGGPCMLTCPGNVVTGNDLDLCSAVVNYPAPTTSGVCGPVVCQPASGGVFPVGTTMINCQEQVIGAPEGLGASCSFDVTVNDTQPPALVCPADVFALAPPGALSLPVDYPTPTPADNCPGVTGGCAPPSGSAFPVGTTAVVCSATDAAANTSACGFDVTVATQAVQQIPTASTLGLAALALLLAAAAFVTLRRTG